MSPAPSDRTPLPDNSFADKSVTINTLDPRNVDGIPLIRESDISNFTGYTKNMRLADGRLNVTAAQERLEDVLAVLNATTCEQLGNWPLWQMRNDTVEWGALVRAVQAEDDARLEELAIKDVVSQLGVRLSSFVSSFNGAGILGKTANKRFAWAMSAVDGAKEVVDMMGDILAGERRSASGRLSPTPAVLLALVLLVAMGQ